MKLNITNIFKFIESKDGRSIPIKLKITKFHDLLTPDDLKVGGNLDLEESLMKSLPDNLEVGGNLEIQYSQIESLPNNLKIEGNFDVAGTPLREKYSREEIKRMVEDKGGYIKGEIWDDEVFPDLTDV